MAMDDYKRKNPLVEMLILLEFGCRVVSKWRRFVNKVLY